MGNVSPSRKESRRFEGKATVASTTRAKSQRERGGGGGVVVPLLATSCRLSVLPYRYS